MIVIVQVVCIDPLEEGESLTDEVSFLVESCQAQRMVHINYDIVGSWDV